MKDFLKSNRILLLFTVIVAATFFGLFMTFNIQLGPRHYTKYYIALIAAESVLFSSFMLVLRGRWRFLIPAIQWCAAILMLANILYYRYWSDLLPLQSILSSASYNSIVFGEVGGLLRFSDILYLLLPGISTAAFLLMRIGRRAVPAPAVSWATVGGVALIWGGAHIMVAYPRYNFLKQTEEPQSFAEILGDRFAPQQWYSRKVMWDEGGLILYSILYIINEKSVKTVALDKAKRERVEAFLKGIDTTPPPDSLRALNGRKNLILIIVESLNADAVGTRVDGRSVTPVLDSLINAPGSVSALKMKPQNIDGGSADGQFIVNTGLLPVHGDAVTMLYPDNMFPSLAGAMGYPVATEVIVESADVWNHRKSSKAYHYNKLIDRVEIGERTRDAAVLDAALREMKTSRRPFMMEITTMTMHSPFSDPYASEAPVPHRVGSERNTAYLRCLAAFDAALGDFIASLRREGLFDQSVIFLASDHDRDPDQRPLRHNIVFLGINTGVTMKVERTCGQIDIFPTILDIMGRTYRYPGLTDPWRGLGTSLLRSERPLLPEAWTVADLMIRSDYFHPQKHL